MDRSATAEWLAELLKSKSEPVWLIEGHFDDGVIRMTDAWKDIAWNGNNYVAQGHFISFSGLTETFDMRIPSVSITLSAVDQTWIAIALTKQFIDRKLVIYKAFINYVDGVVTSPVIMFDGRMDAMPISDDPDGGSCIITVSATNQWSDFERRPGRHTNDQEQQSFFHGDKFFEFASEINKQIKWGAA